MAEVARAPRSPKIILDISQTTTQPSVYSSKEQQSIRHYESSIKVEPCDYCGRIKGSCLCCRNYVKVMTDPYYDRSRSSECLPPMNNTLYNSPPQVHVISDEGPEMISPGGGSNNSFNSMEELNRKRRLSVSDYDYEESPGMYVFAPSDCVYETNAKRGRYDDGVPVQSVPPGIMDNGGVHDAYRKFYPMQYNGHEFNTETPMTVIAIGGSNHTTIDCQLGSQPSPTKPMALQMDHQQQPHHNPPVEAELPPIFTLCSSNESAQQSRQPANDFKFSMSSQVDQVDLDLEDDYDDLKSEDSNSRLMASESDCGTIQPKSTRGRPRNVKQKKNKEKDVSSTYEEMQQMRVMANVRERQRTQVRVSINYY